MNEAVQDTVVQAEDIASVTDTESTSSTKSEYNAEPKFSVEQKDNKFFVNGSRVYTRDDVNKIGANARNEAINGLLKDLDVDSIDQVKDVISTLKQSTIKEDGSSSLDVQSLKQTVAKREATLEDLQNQVSKLKTELMLKDHRGNLLDAMPNAWNQEQRNAVLDLMSARGMFVVEDSSFALKNGDDFLTVDGEKPDYAGAVDLIGKQLNLPFGKKGVSSVSGISNPDDGENKNVAVMQSRLDKDPEYRSAYTRIRTYNPMLNRTDITHDMVMKQIKERRNIKG